MGVVVEEMKRVKLPQTCSVLIARSLICSLPMLMFLCAPLLKAAEAGAWETFSTQSNVDAWSVYDFEDNLAYAPMWNDKVSGNEDVYFYHTGDAGLWFYTGTEDQAGGGVLVGNFTEDLISGIRCGLEIASLADFDQVDCAVYTTGPKGVGYYFSESFYGDDFSEGGWWTLDFRFDTEWFFFDGEDYVAVEVTDEFLSSIEEIGFRVFPNVGTTTEIYAAIDDVQLIPNVEGVTLSQSLAEQHIAFAYSPGRGVSSTLQRMLTSPVIDWEDVAGHTDVTGATEYVWNVPSSEGYGFCRVKSEALFTPFITGG